MHRGPITNKIIQSSAFLFAVQNTMNSYQIGGGSSLDKINSKLTLNIINSSKKSKKKKQT